MSKADPCQGRPHSWKAMGDGSEWCVNCGQIKPPPEMVEAMSPSDFDRLKATLSSQEEEIEGLREMLIEAKLQIEYLHDRQQPTSSGVAVLARIDAALEGSKR